VVPVLKKDNLIGVYSRDEAKHWTIKNSTPELENVTFFVGDIRDYERLERVILQFDPEIIIIAAALKHVDTCELAPSESIKTNIEGPQNVVKVINKNLNNISCDTVLMVSTDKACEPVNVYGMCKSISERVVTSQASYYDSKRIKFIGTRYGNVLDSRGSIIPLFKYQAKNNDCITITDDRMTRFVMTLDESVKLIIDAINIAKSGEILIPKLKAMKIKDLAQIYANISKKPVKTIGIRPGEKIDEKLICKAESLRVKNIGEYYLLRPAHEKIEDGNVNIFDYTSSDDILTADSLSKYLDSLGHLDLNFDKHPGKIIEDIDTKSKK
jgi:UDP-N-acetylglucosamine 4,6-dehydratase